MNNSDYSFNAFVSIVVHFSKGIKHIQSLAVRFSIEHVQKFNMEFN